MVAYEFLTTISESGRVNVPQAYKQQLPKGKAVRVVIWVEETQTERKAEWQPAENDADDELLDELIARIQRTSLNPTSATVASGLLAEHLATPVSEADPDFNEAQWNQEWTAVEKAMDELEAAKEAAKLKDFAT